MRAIHRFLIAVACGGALGLAAPGVASAELTRDAYKQRIEALSAEFDDAGQDYAREFRSVRSTRSKAWTLRRFQRRTYAVALAISRLDPPDFVAAANLELSRALRAIAVAAQPAVSAGLAGRTRSFFARLRTFSDKLNGRVGDRAVAAANRIDRLLAQNPLSA